MANNYFSFKKFTVNQDKAAMKVTTDGCLFGAWTANNINKQPGKHSILDIGTGTGLLSLMIAQKNNDLLIDAVEVDKNAAEQAKENIAASPWQKTIEVFQSDITIYEPQKKYDIIISNPPFYENELKAQTEIKNIAHHNKGLLISDLFTVIKKLLSPNGYFFLLLPFKRNEEIRKLLLEHQLQLDEIVFVKQTMNHGYFRMMVCGRFASEKIAETAISEMAIKDKEDNYTTAFIELLKDYYLFL